jgi:hypothetical protein
MRTQVSVPHVNAHMADKAHEIPIGVESVEVKIQVSTLGFIV